MRRTLTITAALTCAWWAWNASAAPGQDAPARARDTDPASGLELLRASDAALRGANAIAFTVTREGIAAHATRQPHVTARVVAARAADADRAGLFDADLQPQWRVAVFGTAAPPDAEKAPSPFAFAVDASTARMIDVAQQTIIGAGHEHAHALLADSDARAAIEWLGDWETLVGRPIVDDQPRVPPQRDGRVLIGGELTDAVYVDLAEFPQTYAFGAWWYLGVDDQLPRRLELVYYDVRGPDNKSVGDGISRLTISDVQILESPADTAAAVVQAAALLDGVFEREAGQRSLAESIDPDRPFALPELAGFEAVAFQPPAEQQQAGMPAEPPVNIPAPDFTLQDPDGQSHTLSDYQGQIVILDFWATWCPPCLAVMPELQAIHERFKDQGVVVIGVNAWENGDPAALMDQRGFEYLLLLQGDQVAAQYDVTGIPTMVVIDQQGTIVKRKVGAGPRVKDELIETITDLLGEN